MPELPEVETTLRGISPAVVGATITGFEVRNTALRWPVPVGQLQKLTGQTVSKAERRAKYLLLHTAAGTILLHLGMSGSLRILQTGQVAGKHDHLDIEFDGQQLVRLNDPRRFGCCLLIQSPVSEHKLLSNLGPEPLTEDFNAHYLFSRSRGRRVTIKSLIMDSTIVVGVGNIYASESLFLAGIRPTLAAKRLSRKRHHLLADAIKHVLQKAIKAGGTSLSDFSGTDGKPGYFSQQLHVYGRSGEPCSTCMTTIQSKVIAQRNTYFCPVCQRF
ncbi:MAG: bifunctional DNA-formamidopyrimidine glycosylase/DNA-(apurinic or apyrimidinic site) lyase [Arenicella sp.]|nr:bifunctional DNA-formamidopyrimidine glycosylase/DNA-(apurinic or apyrimidinic site) lyase [Arenicella sp.]